ncbi:MAG: tryptophan synthase subunit alpha [Gammaproteobacteria bacterium]|nr:tryptophan synthase subunit alpha [Gammaproteobacteria bacterium]MDP2139222.1 tryptophan synthase subunit alpha [Gammaproteobacteria bacterium]MDP2349009.1 tryptophan synthase subunit alpha [Gammaproteobacteria bacterium]
MSRISKIIASLQAQNKKVLIPYLVAGDPEKGLTVQLMHALVKSGAHIIELGIPFSDPSSDGTVIQLGGERALRQGTTLLDVLAMVTEFRTTDQQTPIVLMGYLNPIEIMGYETFAAAAHTAGVDGVLVVDLPAYECDELFAAVRPRGIDTIFLVAPTTTAAREAAICENSTGYLYYVSLKGVTGAAITDKTAIRDKISHLRTITNLPVVVGFGIKDAESARDMADISDGVIVGSALVDSISHLQVGRRYSEDELMEVVSVIAIISEALKKH